MSDFDQREKKDQEYRKELVELKKIRQGKALNKYAEETREEIRPKTAKERSVNFWYHYRGTIIFVVVLLLLASWLTWDYLTRNRYDINIVVATDDPLIWVENGIQKTLEQYAGDYDGNGKVSVGVALIDIQMTGDGSQESQFQIANKSSLMGKLATSDPVLFLIDDTSYNYMKQAEREGTPSLFEDLTQWDAGNESIQKDRYYIADTKFENNLAETSQVLQEEFPDDFSFCIRGYEGIHADDNPEVKERYENAKNMLENIIKNKKNTQESQ